MKISGIGNVPSKIVDGLNEIGDKVATAAKDAGAFAKDKFDTFTKNESVKNTINKVDKKTAIGAGVVVAALILAVNCIKGVANKVSEIKNK